MSEYVDKKYLDRKFQIDMMCSRGGTIFDTEKIINALPTADVVEREKINKAIEELKSEIEEIAVAFDDDWDDGLELILEILKRNIIGD
jgi:hypothetical protein